MQIQYRFSVAPVEYESIDHERLLQIVAQILDLAPSCHLTLSRTVEAVPACLHIRQASLGACVFAFLLRSPLSAKQPHELAVRRSRVGLLERREVLFDIARKHRWLSRLTRRPVPVKGAEQPQPAAAARATLARDVDALGLPPKCVTASVALVAILVEDLVRMARGDLNSGHLPGHS